MRQRGKRSAASLAVIAVDGRPKRLEPPSMLSDPERAAFVAIVQASDPNHFVPSDVPLLCRYVEAMVLAETAAFELRRGAVVDGKPSPWIVVQEKAVRAMVSLSARLRLSPQGRTDPKTIARRAPVFDGPKPWKDEI